jgi:SAM-dependent methyltransferase
MPYQHSARTVPAMTHHHHQDPVPHEDAHHDAGLTEMLDLDAEVLHDYLADVTSWVHSLAPASCERIVDIGAGTGSGCLALARLFEDAEIVAVDQSADMLARVHEQATAAGLADRVRTVHANLDEGWPATGPVDLVWASMSLHHMADPDRTLKNIMAAMRPGGVLAVVEVDGQPRFLPEDIGIGRPGLEARYHAALEPEHAARVPHLGSDWDARFAATGVPVLERRVFAIDLRAPLPPATGRYAHAYLARIRSALEDRLDAEDLTTLDRLLDEQGPDSVVHREDLTVRTVRTAWLVQRS